MEKNSSSRNKGGRPRKAPEHRLKEGRMNVNLTPVVRERVIDEARALMLDYSAYIRLIILKEFQRLDDERSS